MPNDNQDRLDAAIAKRQSTEQKRDDDARQRALLEQRQRERLQQLQAQGQQLAILINYQVGAQTGALIRADSGDRFMFTPDEPGQSSVMAWRVRVVLNNGKPRGPFGNPELRLSLERSGALIATWPGTRVQPMGPTYRPEEIILVQHEPDQALGPQIEDLLIKSGSWTRTQEHE